MLESNKRTDIDATLLDHGAVRLENDAVNFLELERVRDHLVAGDDVLVNDHVCGGLA